MAPIEERHLRLRATGSYAVDSCPEGSIAQPSLPFQFVTENGRRAKAKSPAMFAVRSQARKYAALERNRKENPARAHRGKKASNLTNYSWVQYTPRETNNHKAAPTNLSPIATHQDIARKGEPRHHGEWREAEAAKPSRWVLNKQSSNENGSPRLKRRLTGIQEYDSDDELLIALSPAIAARRLETQRQLRISLQRLFGHGRSDPFESYPIKAQPYMHKLLDYCFIENQDVAKGWQIKHGQRVTGFSRLNTEFIPLCLTDEMAFISLLLISEFAYQIARGKNSWSLRALKLSMDCVERLRQKIEEREVEVSDTTMITVVNLASCALVFNRDLAAFNSHVNGIRRMANLRGGFRTLDGIVKDEVNWLIHVQNELTRKARMMHSGGYIPALGQEGFLSTLSPEELSSLPYDDVLEVASENMPGSYFIAKGQADADIERESETILEVRNKGAVHDPQRSSRLQKTWTWLS